MMQNISLKQMVSYAVHYECLSTIAVIYPNNELITLAAKSVTKFLKSKDNNLKYLGIEALGQLLTVDPQCGSSHEIIVVDCLSDPDPTIKKKTLDLLYLMANESNVAVICAKFLECLPAVSDVTSQQHLSENVVQMAKNYYQSLEWFLKTLCHLCQVADWSIPSVVTTVIDVIQKEQESHGWGISTTVVDVFLPFTNMKIIKEPLAQLTVWVLGEFSTRDISSLMLEDALESLLLLLGNKDTEWVTDTKLQILSALLKIFAKSDSLEMNLTKHLTPLLKDEEPEIRQRTAELLVLTAPSTQVSKEVLQFGINSGQCDWTLSFLDGYVSDALAQGAAPYKPKQQRTIEEATVQHDVKQQLFSGLNFQPYSAPSTFSHISSSSVTSPTRPDENNSSVPSVGSSEHSNSREQNQPLDSSQLKLEGVKKVWGKSGYIKTDHQKQTSESSTTEKKENTIPSSSTIPSFQVSDVSKPSVQLNEATAIRTKEVPKKNSESRTKEEDEDVDEEVETPEMKQKQDLAKALFGNVQQPKRKDLILSGSSHAFGSSNQSSSLLENNRQVDLLSLSNEPDAQMPVGNHHSSNLKHPSVKLENVSVAQSDQANNKRNESEKNFEDTVTGLNQTVNLLDDSVGSFQGEPGSLLYQISRTPNTDSSEGDHQLPAEFEDFPHSKEFDQLCQDDMMRVTLCKVWKPKELGMVMFLYNKSGSHQITDAEVAVVLPSNLKFLHRDGQKQTEVVGSVNMQSSKYVSLSCICQSPAVNMMLGGEVTYRDHTRTSKRLFFNTAINMSDLLRSHHITTNEFGSLWGKPCHDIRLSHDSFAGELQSLMQLLSSKLSFHTVEIKGNEALAASSLLGGTNCLAHFKLQNKKLDIWLKSSNKRLCEVLNKLILGSVTGDTS
ncbi:AP-4 complex subunit epsilon-1 [Holothuria leucospilota]|uniref:AP-4 complex subunit epsilon-1 n=1 Tax=Holothuria leucospilota TaxID=206669 RepID=A0A9Q1H8I0_HOLLE|nr:AP-4 complex subunit epsilon-1 [Holothuria leucospilota]